MNHGWNRGISWLAVLSPRKRHIQGLRASLWVSSRYVNYWCVQFWHLINYLSSLGAEALTPGYGFCSKEQSSEYLLSASELLSLSKPLEG